MTDSQEYDICRIVLYAQPFLCVIHDIIDSVWLFRLDLTFEVYLEAPQDKALLFLFGLFEENIDYIVDWSGNSQQLFLFTNVVVFLWLFLDGNQILNVVDFITSTVEDSQQLIL